MKGYIYITSTGTDPGCGHLLNDPKFGNPPTLGACMPPIRRSVVLGDYVFVVTGSVPGVQQYVVGGMEVSEKIDALAAYKRFPQYRLKQLDNGDIDGNIVVNAKGRHHPLDHHQDFENRITNYIVGRSGIFLEKPTEIVLGRRETLPTLQKILEKRGNRLIDVMGRWRKLDEPQVRELISWLQNIKDRAD